MGCYPVKECLLCGFQCSSDGGLSQSSPTTGALLPLQHYADHDLKLRKFVPIIQRSLVYPVILDAKRTVLSLPPIINGAHSAVRVLVCTVLSCHDVIARSVDPGCVS